jgi:hypothetical protein
MPYRPHPFQPPTIRPLSAIFPPPRFKTPFLPKGSFYSPPMADAEEMVLAKKMYLCSLKLNKQ